MHLIIRHGNDWLREKPTHTWVSASQSLKPQKDQYQNNSHQCNPRSVMRYEIETTVCCSNKSHFVNLFRLKLQLCFLKITIPKDGKNIYQ